MKKILLPFLLVTLLVLPAHGEMHGLGMMGFGEGHGPMEGGGMDAMAENMGACLDNAARIGLSEDQVKKLTPLHREMKKKQVRFRADLKLAEMDHMEIMEVKDFDLEKANASVRKIADLKTAYHLDMLKLMKEVRAILSEEQFRKMKELMPQKPAGRKPAKTMKHKH
jgi:Spy/CpxP family protein refolding chaperone